MEPFEAIADALQRSHLLGGEGPWLEWRQAQLADALGRIADGEQVGRLSMDPGRETRERGQVVVHRRRRETGVGQGALPGQDVPLEDIPDSLVVVCVLIEGAEAIEVQGDLI